MWFSGPAGLCGTVSPAVLADPHDGDAAQGHGAAGSGAGKPTAAAAAHHSHCAWQQSGWRRSLHRPPQHTYSHGNRHVDQWGWNGFPWAHGHHGNSGQCRAGGWSPAASPGGDRLADKVVRSHFYSLKGPSKFFRKCICLVTALYLKCFNVQVFVH